VQELEGGAVGGEALLQGGVGGGVGGGLKGGADVDQGLGHGGVAKGGAQELHMGNLVAGNLVQQVLGLRGQALSLPAADGLRAAAAQLLVQGGAVASALVEVGLLRGCGAGGASRG
jgi:hypothetical protein